MGRKHTEETKQLLSERMTLHGGYRELQDWKRGKRTDRRTTFGN
jgi:hypothetical protein